MAAKKVVVVGGGIAGMAVARTLKEKLGDQVDVTVVTKDTFYAAGPSRPLMLTGEQKYDRIIRGYEEAGRLGIHIAYGYVTRIDPAERKVYVADSPTRAPTYTELSYDYLVLAPGVVYDGSSIEGWRENLWRTGNAYEFGRIDVLRRRIWTEKKGTVIIYAPPMPYRCAPAPSETTLLIDTVLRHRGVRENFRIIHLDANDKPQPAAIADILKAQMEERGIELITSRQITELHEDHVVLDNGEKLEYTILALLEPNRAPKFITEAGLGDKWVEVRSPTNLRTPKYDDILAAGDAAKLPFPKNQEIAYESALFAANNIIEEFGGEPVSVQYAFLGWVYVGNPEGKLESLSIQFGLNFTTKPPKVTKEPTPKREYTLQKDRWEQSYLNRLFHEKEA